jgi:glycosyltransferase involved in cell wall biosynthesis
LVAGTPHIDYVNKLGIPHERIFMGYDVVDNEHFTAGAEAARSNASADRARYALPEEYFIACARFIEEKNLIGLISGFARYRQLAGARAWKLVLVGDGPERADVIRAISRFGVEDAVVLAGFRQYHELPVFYGLAGALVHASTRDTWALVVNEAMASGLPVLVSEQCGCARDLVQAGANGFTFNPAEVERLAELMCELAHGESDRRSMSQKSLDIISRWSIERFADSLWKATDAAQSVRQDEMSTLDKALFWLLLHRGLSR